MARKQILLKDVALVDVVERIGVGLLYAAADLSQNNIADILGIGDDRVNKILKGIKKPGKKK